MSIAIEALNKLIEQTIGSYEVKPSLIVGEYNREIKTRNDYQGRQVFELLQNADDQFIEDVNCDVNVFFEIVGTKFIIQNTGVPFSVEGIDSLMNADISPKALRKGTIGHKGLGFRSVLNWCNSLKIITNEFAVEFDKEYAEQELKKLINKNDKVKAELEKKCEGNFIPAAILSFPRCLLGYVPAVNYETRIELDLYGDLVDLVKAELSAFDFRELLFLKHIHIITVKIEDDIRIIERLPVDNQIYIKETINGIKSDDKGIWTIYKDNGVFNDGLVYEFTIASTDKKSIQNELRDKGVLYSYFKTDLQMPFPFIIHATLELSSDRNTLQKDSKYNKALIEELVSFIGQTAKSIVEDSAECNYEPLKLLLPKNNISIVLDERFDFTKKLLSQIEKLSVFPTIEGKYISLIDFPKWSEYRFDRVVRSATFNKLLKYCDDDIVRSFLKTKLPFFDIKTTVELIDFDADFYSSEEKIELIKLFLKQFKYASLAPKILIDNKGKRISDESKVFNNPDKFFNLPDWAEIRFINALFESGVKAEFGLQTGRSLSEKLSCFNCEEYSFDRVLQQLVSRAGIDTNRIKELLKWLFNYWRANDYEFNSEFKNIYVKTLARGDEIVKCSDCYFGVEYNNIIGENVLTAIGAKFLIESNEFDFGEVDIEYKIKFFKNLGVCKYPKLITKNLDTDILTYFNENLLEYPSISYDLNKDTLQSIAVEYIEKIEEILTKTNFEDILLWLIMDANPTTILSKTEINARSNIKIHKYNTRWENTYEVPNTKMLSYLRQKFREVKWILGKDGGKFSCSECTLTDDKLYPLLNVIYIDYDRLYKRVGRSIKREVEMVFEKLGVANDFTELPKEKIYDIFLQLPTLKIDANIVRSVYNKFNLRFVADDIEKIITNNNAKYNEFQKNGQVLCEQNREIKYKPARDVFYANNKIYSEDILSKYPILTLNRRAGEDKIKKAFCVRSIKEIGGIKVESPIYHFLNEDFQKEYRKILPYIFARRIGNKSENIDFNHLMNSKVQLVSSVVTKCTIDEENIIGTLKDYESIQVKEGKIAFIKIPDMISDIEKLKGKKEFCGTLSEIFTVILNVEGDKDFFREIIGASRADREYIYKDNGDVSLEILNMAKEKFKKDLDYKAEFWNAIAQAMGDNPEESDISKEYSQIIGDDFNYIELCNKHQTQSIIQLFSELGIDISDYNGSGAFQQIDITTYWIEKYKLQKKNYLYQFNGEKLWEDAFYLLDAPYFDNSIVDKVDEILQGQVEKIISNVSLEKINLKDTTINIQKHTEANNAEQKEFILIKKEIESKDSLPIVDVLIGKADDKEPSNNGTYETNHKTGIFDAAKKLLNGYIGEKEVYKRLHYLLENGKILAYEWISSNALKDGAILESEADDGKGYDFKVAVDESETIYVEVKASSQSGINFDITKNEINVARKENNKEHYHIYFVPIKNHIAQEIQDLGCIFNFGDDEDFFSNNNFTIEEKTFTIRATKK